MFKKSGDTYFRTFGTIIGSESLTTVFGMETGVAFQIWSPEEARRAVKLRRACVYCVTVASARFAPDPGCSHVLERWIYAAKLSSISTG